MEPWKQETLDNLHDSIRREKEAIETVAAALNGVSDRLDYREIWHLVGDPSNHPIKAYRKRVDAMSRKFHEARAVAAQKVRAAGESKHYKTYYREVARGLYSLGCLRVAGYLYAAHVIAIVDVRHHQSVVESITQKLPAFA